MSLSVAPPSPQEIQRKLSVHSVTRVKPFKGPMSGTESDSDSILTPDVSMSIGPSSQPPLSSIAERRSNSGEDTEDEEDAVEGGWKTADIKPRSSVDECVIKAGYLWKKGERRKTWKKRWFVLRPAHLAYYKSSAEYKLLRLLELSDVHSCTQVNLKRHDNTFGLISSIRTFYLQAATPQEMQNWVTAIEDATQTLLATTTLNSVSTPIPIPQAKGGGSRGPFPPTSSPSVLGVTFTSSESEDAMPIIQQRTQPATSSSNQACLSPTKSPAPQKDPSKVLLSGYLMKCGSKRRNWRKRWFVLTGEKLVYSRSHMDTKPHRQFPFNDILDALEYDLQSQRQYPGTPSSPHGGYHVDADDAHIHTFKIVTTKRTLLLCAPSEDDEIKWMGAIRALIARRTGSGMVPGRIKFTSSQTTQPGSSNLPPVAASTSASAAIKGKVRRLSAAGSNALGIPHPEQEMREAKTS